MATNMTVEERYQKFLKDVEVNARHNTSESTRSARCMVEMDKGGSICVLKPDLAFRYYTPGTVIPNDELKKMNIDQLHDAFAQNVLAPLWVYEHEQLGEKLRILKERTVVPAMGLYGQAVREVNDAAGRLRGAEAAVIAAKDGFQHAQQEARDAEEAFSEVLAKVGY